MVPKDVVTNIAKTKAKELFEKKISKEKNFFSLIDYSVALHPALKKPKMVKIFIVFLDVLFPVNPYYLYHTGPFSELFRKELRNMFYWGSSKHSSLILEYRIEEKAIKNNNSSFNETLRKIQKQYRFKIQFYCVKKETRFSNIKSLQSRGRIDVRNPFKTSKTDDVLINEIDYDDLGIKTAEMASLRAKYSKELQSVPFSKIKFENISELLQKNMVENGLFYSIEGFSSDFCRLLGASGNIMAFLDLNSLKHTQFTHRRQELRKKLFSAPFGKIFSLKNISENSIPDTSERYLLILISLKQNLGSFLSDFSQWCDRRNIPGQISPYFDCSNFDHPKFNISALLEALKKRDSKDLSYDDIKKILTGTS